MAQHTPGPWIAETDRRFREMESTWLPESIGVRGPDGNFVAASYDFNRTDRDAEVEANARLIAAAPELLAACAALMERFEHRQPCCPEARYTAAAHLRDCPYLTATKLVARVKGCAP